MFRINKVKIDIKKFKFVILTNLHHELAEVWGGKN